MGLLDAIPVIEIMAPKRAYSWASTCILNYNNNFNRLPVIRGHKWDYCWSKEEIDMGTEIVIHGALAYATGGTSLYYTLGARGLAASIDFGGQLAYQSYDKGNITQGFYSVNLSSVALAAINPSSRMITVFSNGHMSSLFEYPSGASL